MKIFKTVFVLVILSLRTLGQDDPYIKYVFPADLDKENIVIHQLESMAIEKKMMIEDSTIGAPINRFPLNKNPKYLDDCNHHIDKFIEKGIEKLGLNYSRQPYTHVRMNGKLSTDYDTSKYKYLIRHKWVWADASYTTASGYSNWGSSYQLVFYFYDMKNDRSYKFFGHHCGPIYIDPARPLNPDYFFASLYKYIKWVQIDGLDSMYGKASNKQRKICNY